MAEKNEQKLIRRKVQAYIESLRKNRIKVWRLYLYGSFAKGTNHRDSDIDLAVFLDKKKIDPMEEDVRLMKLRWDIDLRIEPHSFARSDFTRPDPFIQEIVKSGERIL